MAYVDETLLDDEQNQEGGPVSGASSSGVATKSAQASPGEIAKRGSGNFQNLGEYLRVNAPQQFGQKVAGKIGDEITSAGQTLDQAQGDFKSRVDEKTVRDTGNLASQVSTDPRLVNQDEFAKVRDAEYKGPQSLYDAKDLSSRVQSATGTATGKANASQSEGGRFALLDSYFGKPQYNQGQKTLDNLLIQNDPGSQQAFDQMRQNAQALEGRAKQLAPEAQQYAAMGQQATKDARAGARSAVGIDDAGNLTGQGAIGAIKGQIPARTAAKNYRLGQEFNDASSMAAQNKFGLTPEFLAAMGVTGNRGYGVDPTGYLSQASPVTDAQTITGDEAGRLQALEKLSGSGPLFDDYSKADTARDAKAYQFDKDRYSNDVTAQKSAYTSAASQIDTQVTAAQNQINQILSDQSFWLDPPERQRLAQPYVNQLTELKRQKSLLDQKYLGSGIGMDAFPNARS